MAAENAEDVSRQLGAVVELARSERHRRGYFAAMYQATTGAVRAGIAAGAFDDDARMDRFVTVFASRYLDAVDAQQAGRTPTRAWQAAFACNERHDRLILQHVVVGVNAHINLDLGVAAAEVAGAAPVGELKADFDRINAVIGSLLDAVQAAIGRFSPMLDLLWRVGDAADDEVLNFSFRVARDEAWRHALILAGQRAQDRPATIESFDRAASVLGRLVSEPGGILGLTVPVVRHTEREDIPAVIDALAACVPEPAV